MAVGASSACFSSLGAATGAGAEAVSALVVTASVGCIFCVVGAFLLFASLHPVIMKVLAIKTIGIIFLSSEICMAFPNVKNTMASSVGTLRWTVERSSVECAPPTMRDGANYTQERVTCPLLIPHITYNVIE
jgi:hypothetical protein